MKKRLLVIASLVMILSFVTGGVAFAFSSTNTDGVWGRIDGCTPSSIYLSKYVYNERTGIFGDMDALAIVIFNGTGSPVSLGNYSLRLYYGTGGAYNTVGLSNQTLANNGTWVLVNYGYMNSVSGENQTFTDNEDYTTVVLYKGSEIIDMIGSTASTPPKNPAGTPKTDHTFTRKWICNPDPDGDDPLYKEWSIENDDDFNDLGSVPVGAGASCDRYASGGDDTLGGIPSHIQNDWWDQTTGASNTDFNQVRYGGTEPNCTTAFQNQSGMGFKGTAIPNGTGFKQPFLLGTFCHYNNPVSATNAFDNIDLNVTISGIQCEAPLIPGPAVPPDMTFTYNFLLDETTNTEPCSYTSPSNNPCSDAIFVAQDPSPNTFICQSPGTPPVDIEYTAAVLGFMKRNSDGTCPAWNASQALGNFISNEGTSNCGCMYAMITDFTPLAVNLLSFTGVRVSDGILLEWETSNEVDNVGFNLYRATSMEGQKVRVNAELIPTNVMPGGLVGAAYSFEDASALSGENYFYWLEDVDAQGNVEMHGPILVP